MKEFNRSPIAAPSPNLYPNCSASSHSSDLSGGQNGFLWEIRSFKTPGMQLAKNANPLSLKPLGAIWSSKAWSFSGSETFYLIFTVPGISWHLTSLYAHLLLINEQLALMMSAVWFSACIECWMEVASHTKLNVEWRYSFCRHLWAPGARQHSNLYATQ